MSLINEMLRDLQKRKGEGPPRKSSAGSRLTPIPLLPLPVLLGACGLILVGLIWWLSGVLSELWFPVEPRGEAVSQEVVAERQTDSETPSEAAHAEPDQLTAAERLAEPPVDKPVMDKPAASPSPAAQVQRVSKDDAADASSRAKIVPARKKDVDVTRAAATPAPTVAPPAEKQVKKSKVLPPPRDKARLSAMSRSKRPLPAATVLPPPAPALHPDDLPGAVSSRETVREPAAVRIARPARVEAATPFGQAEELYRDARWALENEQAKLAGAVLEEALEIYPGHLAARSLLVGLLEQGHQTGEALYLLEQGLEIAPDYLPFKKSYAQLLSEQGDFETALGVLLESGLPDVKDDPEAHVILASLYQRLGEYFLAAQTYRNLLVAWPQTGAFWVGLGGALEGQGLVQDALDCYRRALKTEGLRDDLSRYAHKRLRQLG